MDAIRPALLVALVVIAPVAARAACADDVATAYARANALPPSNGRAALLEQIQRAEIAHHEGDEDECRTAVGDAVDVLDQLKSSQRRTTP